MADFQVGNEARGIKLFGTTISLQNHKQNIDTTATNQDSSKSLSDSEVLEKRPDKIVPCPRCKSMETKFCYFNNYNVNQPRHFCRGCQRYWTAGGALRNVPVGAGRRKTKPTFRGSGGFPEGCFFEASSGGQQLDFDEVVEEWQLAAMKGGFEHVFPMKRRRSISGGQSC